MSAISNFLNQIKTAIYGEQVRDAIHDSILQCYTDVTNGVTLAQNAASGVTRAIADANGAANQANAAAYSANNAASSATTAANNANTAANNASNAKEAANSAASVATSAANQANDAATAANAAAQAATTAKENTDTATTAANSAAEAANTAAGAANTAKDDAIAATEAATTAAETINDKGPGVVENVSGAIASFSDGSDDMPVKNLVVNIEPVQDLHGYDYPWPAGGGKNLWGDTIMANDMARIVGVSVDTTKKTVSITKSGSENYITNGVVFKEAMQYTFILNGSVPVNSNANLMFVYTDGTNDRDLGRFFKVGANVSAPGKTVSGLYKRNYLGTTVINYETSGLFEGNLTADQFSPYSNICPIEGWTGVKVVKTGFNLWDEEWENGTFNTSNASNIIMPDQIRSKNFIEVKPGASYYINAPGDEGIWIAYFDRDKKILTKKQITDGNARSRASNCLSYKQSIMTVSDLCHYIRFYCVKSYGATYKNDICINLSDPARNGEYEPYQGETYDISIPSEAGTVYGGSLNAATGVLTVDRANVDLGSLNWSYVSNSSFNMRSNSSLENALIPEMATSPVYAICTSYQVLTYQNTSSIDKSLTIVFKGTTGGRVWVNDSAYNDVTAFKNAMDGVQLVYKLATPLTYHLTPTQVKTLLGQNNIFADSGDVNVDYIADTKIYIDKKFTELQALVLENVGG